MTSTTRALPRRDLAAVLLAAALAAGLLTCATWQPYSLKVPLVHRTGTLGPSLLASGGSALDYARAYLTAIWPALVAGLLLAAAVEVLLPARWLQRALGREGLGSSLRGSAAALPSMMCTCCAAPVAVGLRRWGAAVGPALAVWVGNPALNPVVIAFAAFVLPWELVALRVAFGVLLVAGLALLVRGRAPAVVAAPADDVPATPTGYLRALARLALRLVPEYLLLIVVVGALRGLLPMDGTALGVGAVLLLAAVGTLMAVPTGAEVAAAAALLAVGAGTGAAVALLLSLPALSLPSLLMVRSVFPRDVLLSATAAVAAVSGVVGLVALTL
ncbi:MAG: permease [Frankiales bacterium]|nr:permease [Frankiales bacterium]